MICLQLADAIRDYLSQRLASRLPKSSRSPKEQANPAAPTPPKLELIIPKAAEPTEELKSS
ncbi:MAG: hypothetical protein HC845_07520 [Akkermansiaceae bacterium]|nr:hypothetical protein [Akkermansiaceae bacterium]